MPLISKSRRASLKSTYLSILYIVHWYDLLFLILLVLLQLISLLLPSPKKQSNETKSTAPEVKDGCLSKGNVIIYVWRQMDAEAVAENIQASGIEGGVVVYHGGMDAGARSRAQSKVSKFTYLVKGLLFY